MSTINFETVSLNQLELHPTILSIIPNEPLNYLFQDSVSTPTLRSLLLNPIGVVKKKGMRKNKKYYVLQNILNFLAAQQLYIRDEEVKLLIFVSEDLDDTVIENQLLLELTGFKRSSKASATIAAAYKGLEEKRDKLNSPFFASPNINDIAHSRAYTLRDISGFDRRAYHNSLKTGDMPEKVFNWVKENL